MVSNSAFAPPGAAGSRPTPQELMDAGRALMQQQAMLRAQKAGY